MTITDQRRAVLTAMKESKRELIKAKEAKNTDWIEDVERTIDLLADAAKSLESLETLREVIASLTEKQ